VEDTTETLGNGFPPLVKMGWGYIDIQGGENKKRVQGKTCAAGWGKTRSAWLQREGLPKKLQRVGWLVFHGDPRLFRRKEENKTSFRETAGVGV